MHRQRKRCARRSLVSYAEKVWKTLMSIERRRNKEKRSVRTLMSLLSEAGYPRCAGWTGWPGWGDSMHRRHRRWCAVEIKVLKDLDLMRPPSIYRHSGPYGPVAIGSCAARGYYPGHPAHPGHPASGTETQQEVWRKGLEDLNVYSTAEARRRKGP